MILRAPQVLLPVLVDQEVQVTTPVETKVVHEGPDLDGVTKSWIETLEILEEKTDDRYERAYKKVLDLGDDIYLL